MLGYRGISRAWARLYNSACGGMLVGLSPLQPEPPREHLDTFGCRQRIDGGKAQGTICVD
jgi:hypothetical protein